MEFGNLRVGYQISIVACATELILDINHCFDTIALHMNTNTAITTMTEITTTITRRGQVTVPAQVRRMLGVKAKDKVTFTIEGKKVHLAPAAFTLESAYGSVKASKSPEDFKAIIHAAKDAKAEEMVKKLRKRS